MPRVKKTPGAKGAPAVYRGKVRAPLVFTLTADARVQMERHRERTSLSRSDFLEYLIRHFGKQVPEGLVAK